MIDDSQTNIHPLSPAITRQPQRVCIPNSPLITPGNRGTRLKNIFTGNRNASGTLTLWERAVQTPVKCVMIVNREPRKHFDGATKTFKYLRKCISPWLPRKVSICIRDWGLVLHSKFSRDQLAGRTITSYEL